MASYKVPQDVEADDKLIGPFSFRQFIYLIIAILGIAMAWGFSRLFIPLAIIPLPIVIFFGALALPLRKDQPMEIYLAAMVSFYLKPRRRLWQPDGIQSLIEIVAPRVAEVQRTKDLSQTEAEQRLSYLADIADTKGWSVRGVAMPQAANSMNTDVYYAAQQTPDILDDSGGVARSFDTMITQSDQKRREDMIARMRSTAQTPRQTPQAAQPPTTTVQTLPQPATQPQTPAQSAQTAPLLATPSFNPYPSMHQAVINPIGNTPPAQQPQPTPQIQNNPQTTSDKPISPDIINLANNSDLSIETIAHEAGRIKEKEEAKSLDDEVVISLH